MLFLVLYDILISVFLRSLVIVVVSGPKKVKVFCLFFVPFHGFLFLLYSIPLVIIII
jgi:hypothetical protein